jgi:class 3 adenylate cyclase
MAGNCHIPSLAEVDLIADHVEQFLTASWDAEAPTAEQDRVLATVLFTDIVNSTAHIAELGDAGWRSLLETHHALVRRQLARHRGRELDTAGDGFFATFDGPARGTVRLCSQPGGQRPRNPVRGNTQGNAS